MSSIKSKAENYWRSLDELAETSEFQGYLHREFKDVNVDAPGSVSRRRFMQLMGASLALSSASGCILEGPGMWAKEKILPHTRRPAGLVPGQTKSYATLFNLGGFSQGLSVTSYEGRPIKIEGNPLHPASLGACSTYAQASILGLYDPDRSQQILQGGKPSDAKTFDKYLSKLLGKLKANGGQNLRVLAEPSASVTLAKVKADFLSAFPKATWTEFTTFNRDNVDEGAQIAFGAGTRVRYNVAKAEIIVNLDGDFLTEHPEALRHTKEWGDNRNPEAGKMNRLYAVESHFSSSGVSSDHRLPLRHEQLKPFLLALQGALKAHGVTIEGPEATPNSGFLKAHKIAAWVKALAKDLAANQGKSLLTVGYRQPAEVHALAHRLNVALGNLVKTLSVLGIAAKTNSNQYRAIKTLASDMNTGKVDTLLILGANPAYSATGDLKFGEAMNKVKNKIHLGLYANETAALATWHLPETHALATWSDGRSFSGTYSVAQPLLEPLYKSHSQIELLLKLMGREDSAYALVRATALTMAGGNPAALEAEKADTAPSTANTDTAVAAAPNKNDRTWRKLVQDGIVPNTDYPVKTDATLQSFSITPPNSGSLNSHDNLKNGEYEITFIDDGKVYDGRFANNGSLQELPDFTTKLTWDNAALLSPSTAKTLKVNDGQMIKLEIGGQSVTLPVYTLPGQPTGSIAVALGYGREEAGHVGGSAKLSVASPGFDVSAIRRSSSAFQRKGVTITATGADYELASTQNHHAIDDTGYQERERRAHTLIRETSLAEYQKDPGYVDSTKYEHHLPVIDKYKQEQLFGALEYKADHQWGMSIDLSKCNGCNACIMACNTENIVPVAGKDQVLKGREMQWLRLDRYFAGDEEDPTILSQPVACVHCENAPCEQVCPVAATLHTEEGLNDMVYNRCVGTRYCLNNCPLKVRRFNYHNYHEDLKTPENKVKTMQFNPDVTVRFRAVMEKCTYCIQRIKQAKDTARNEKRPLADGDITPACAQTCGSDAIVFGDINDKNSRVSKLRKLARSYGMLGGLNLRPRTEMLGKIRNVNPDLAKV